MKLRDNPKVTAGLMTLTLACGLFAAHPIHAQAPSNPPKQNPPADSQKTPPKPPANSNPFPEDTTNVPVMPDAKTLVAPDAPEYRSTPAAVPANDSDPVRSPDDPAPGISGSSDESSSSAGIMDKVLQPPDADTDTGRRRGKQQPQPAERQETAADDENVGSYYLSNKNWRAALSRFESAVVLDPDNPEVYWGLAEAQRHLGDYAKAKANYQKVFEYDPDSKHAKEAKKILKDPELANAAPLAASRPSTPPQ